MATWAAGMEAELEAVRVVVTTEEKWKAVEVMAVGERVLAALAEGARALAALAAVKAEAYSAVVAARAVADRLEVQGATAVAAAAAMELAVMGTDSLAAVEAPAEMPPASPAGKSVVADEGAGTGPSR